MSVTITPRKRKSTYQGGTPKRPRSARTLFAASAVGLARAAKAYAPTRVPRSMSGFPSTKSVMMRYCTAFTLSSTTGTLPIQRFRANSIYDPDYTGAGHQPLGHDQWAQFYTSYVVTSSKITVWFSNAAGVETTLPVIGIILQDGTAVGTDLELLIEQGKSKWAVATPSNQSGGPVPRIKGIRYDAKSFFNVADVKDNLTRIGADFNNNPSDEADYVVWAQGSDQASTLALTCLAVIEYKVLMSEPKQLPQS